MKNLHKRAELLANIAIIIVAIMLSVVLIKRFVLDGNEPPRPAFDQLEVRGTPTLILVDESGVAVDVWKGKLPPDAEERVLSKLKA